MSFLRKERRAHTEEKNSWMLRLELLGKRSRGRPKRRFMDVAEEDARMNEEDVEDGVMEADESLCQSQRRATE